MSRNKLTGSKLLRQEMIERVDYNLNLSIQDQIKLRSQFETEFSDDLLVDPEHEEYDFYDYDMRIGVSECSDGICRIIDSKCLITTSHFLVTKPGLILTVMDSTGKKSAFDTCDPEAKKIVEGEPTDLFDERVHKTDYNTFILPVGFHGIIQRRYRKGEYVKCTIKPSRKNKKAMRHNIVTRLTYKEKKVVGKKFFGLFDNVVTRYTGAHQTIILSQHDANHQHEHVGADNVGSRIREYATTFTEIEMAKAGFC